MRLVPRRLLPLLFLAPLPVVPAVTPATAGPCDGSGTVVVTDPVGDVDSPQHDITAITMAEGFGGAWTGWFRVGLQLAATDPPDSETTGLWVVSWKEFGGDSTMTLSVSRCRGDFTGTYTWQSSDGQSSVTGPLDGLIVTPGRMDLLVSREKFGNPPPGSALTDVGATTLVTDLLPAPLACAPTLRTDVAASGTYVMGECVVGVRDRPVASAVLGPPVPNPARSGVRMRLELPGATRSGTVEGEVLDAAGRVVHRFSQPAGTSVAWLSWDLRDEAGHRAPPGTYWARVRAGDFTASRSVVVLR